MKLVSYFSDFLSNTVNLDQNRLDQLDTHVGAIVGYMSQDKVIGPMYKDHIPQGSWAHRTIIRPLPNHEFDADFLLLLTENKAWSKTPGEYLRQVRAAFKRSATYQTMVNKKNRCVRIVYANDCHVDVVPHLVLEDGRQVIVNYAEDKFEDTNPQGFTEWMREKDTLAQGHLRTTIRLVKYLRDFKQAFSCPSVILTTLLGERVQAVGTLKRYADLPTALAYLVSDLDRWLQFNPNMPVISDPSCPGTDFNHRWDQTRYANFRNQIHSYSTKIVAAYNDPDQASSLTRWQDVFGPDFKAAATTQQVAVVQKTPATPIKAPFEEFIEERGYAISPSYKARIDCTVRPKPGFRSGPLRSMPRLAKDRRLQFKLTTDTPEPFDLFWKVRNTGPDALSPERKRGQLLADDGSHSRNESTLYRGRHYIEAYVVKDKRVVATDHHDVVIE